MGKIVYVGLLTFVLICTSTEEVDEKNTTVSKRMFAAFTEGQQFDESGQSNQTPLFEITSSLFCAQTIIL